MLDGIYDCPVHHITVGMCCGRGKQTGTIEYPDIETEQRPDDN